MAQPIANPVAHRIGPAAHAIDAPWVLRLWHLASFDAPTVALVWALGFAWTVRIQLPVWVLVDLALITWSAYVADRLLDAQRASAERTSSHTASRLRDRHIFHWKHRRALTPLSAIAALIAVVVALARMLPSALARGSVLGAAALVYFAGVHTGKARAADLTLPAIAASRRRPGRLLPKELLVGLIFTAGCVLPTLNRATDLRALIAPGAYFALLAWLNCAAIDAWEAPLPGASSMRGASSQEPGNHTGSCVRRPSIRVLALLLGAAGWPVALSIGAAQPRSGALIAAASTSALLLALLERLRALLTPLALRAAADLVLLTPLALLWR